MRTLRRYVILVVLPLLVIFTGIDYTQAQAKSKKTLEERVAALEQMVLNLQQMVLSQNQKIEALEATLFKVGAISQEISSLEARKALGQMGIEYTERAFIESVMDDDVVATELFVAAGMDVNLNVRDKTRSCNRPILLVALQKSATVAKALLDKGADVNAEDDCQGLSVSWTALHLAAYSGYTEIVKALLDKGADVNAKRIDFDETALMLAAKEGHTDIVEALLEKGADLNIKDRQGETALMLAAKEGHTDIVEALLEKGADLNIKDRQGETALRKARFLRHTEIVQLLDYEKTLSQHGEPGEVSEDEAEKVFGLKIDNTSFKFPVWRSREYIENNFEDQDEVVIDHATELMWQRSGSDKELMYEEAQAYIKQLNRQQFAGYHDWRLPTLPELMSLLKPEKQLNDSYINPIFDAKQTKCWSTEKESLEWSAWHVSFNLGIVDWDYFTSHSYVRAVRSLY